MFAYPFKSYLYHHGLRARLPYGLLKPVADAHDILRKPADYARRRRAAARILTDSPWRGFVPRRDAFRRLAPGELPGLDELAAAGRAAYDRRRAEIADGVTRPGSNPFHMLLTAAELAAHPVFLDTALSPPLVEIAADYFGVVPRVDYLDLWVTRPNMAPEGLYNSQKYHLDKPEVGILTLFLNIHEVRPENGPFSFLPAAASAAVRRASGYERHYYHGDGRLSDAQIDTVAGPGEVMTLAGPAGSGGLVDTSACLHFGSRCADGERVQIVIRYMPAHKGRSRYCENFAGYRGQGGALERLLLAGTPGRPA